MKSIKLIPKSRTQTWQFSKNDELNLRALPVWWWPAFHIRWNALLCRAECLILSFARLERFLIVRPQACPSRRATITSRRLFIPDKSYQKLNSAEDQRVPLAGTLPMLWSEQAFHLEDITQLWILLPFLRSREGVIDFFWQWSEKFTCLSCFSQYTFKEPDLIFSLSLTVFPFSYFFAQQSLIPGDDL